MFSRAVQPYSHMKQHARLRQIAFGHGTAFKASLHPRRCFGAVAAEAQSKQQAVDFNNAQMAFQSKTTFELMRGWAVFNTCSFGFIVRNCSSLYGWSVKILGDKITHFFLRHSFFAHFCAGESIQEITPRMEFLRRHGIGGILDYAAEAKDDESETEKKQQFHGMVTARVPQYQSESICDKNVDIFKDAIRGVRGACPDGFAAIKLSGLGDPKLLERLSRCLVETEFLFLQMSEESLKSTHDKTAPPFYLMDRSLKMDFEAFREGWKRQFHIRNEDNLEKLFSSLDNDGDGFIGFEEWYSGIKLSEINGLTRRCIEQGPLARAALDDAELELYRRMIKRVETILSFAQEQGVRVMIDAEWMDIQPAIDRLVLYFQRMFNKGDHPIVFATYQTYLKGMDARVVRDLHRSKHEGWCFGAKVVRGAYMVSEREKANQRGVESPVCETYEDTDANFHRAIDAILSHNADKSSLHNTAADAEVLVASHNKHSIEFVLQRIQELGVNKDLVYFGQLLGMADHLTFTLGANGYKAYKYVPYGPIDEVVPYLIRRTQENSSILGSPGVQEERLMTKQECRRRLLHV